MSDTATIRQFLRTVTRVFPLMGARYLDRPRPLAASRLLYEIGPEGAAVGALRLRLGVDSGYLSRLLRRLEGEGLVETRRDDGDGRRRVAHLTSAGRRERDELDRRSDAVAAGFLDRLRAGERSELVRAVATAERLMRIAGVTIDVEDPRSADARYCLDAYYAELASRFDTGFDPARSAVEPDEMEPPRGLFIVARYLDRPVGCGAIRFYPHFAEIKRMWVHREVRGARLGSRLLERLEHEAAAAGFLRTRLDTNSVLTSAAALYRRHGYREIPRYNENRYADLWFEKRLGAAVGADQGAGKRSR